MTYVKPTARLGADGAGTGAPISFGAVLRARKDGEDADAAPVAQLLSRPRTPPRAPSGATSRARPPARSTCAGACGTTSGWPSAPTSARSTARSATPTASSPTPPRDAQALLIARPRRELPPQPAARHLPGHRLAAGLVDLDRRRHRPARRADRRVAVARGRLRRVRSLYSARLGKDLSRAVAS